MSEHLFRFLLSELVTVRLVCQQAKCQAVLEIKVSQLGAVMSGPDPTCKVCGASFLSPTGVGQNHFPALAAAFQGLAKAKGQVEIEFVLPDRPPSVP